MNFQIKSFIGGMNSDVSGTLIRGDQYRKGVNVSSRGGSLHTRPLLDELAVALDTGIFQGSSVFSLNSADREVFAVAGHIYTYNFATSTLTQVTDASTRMDQTVDTFWFLQAEQYFIVQDGVNLPLILNYTGTNPDQCRKSYRVANGDSTNEIPIGAAMAYGHGRISVAIRELSGNTITERFFAVGDIMLPTSPETVLRFTEIDYLSGGGAISLPNELGLIHGMAFLKNQQSSNGLGSLIVFARNGASAFKINAPRGQWQDIDISNVMFTGRNSGTFAGKSITAVNNDLVYRSIDGIRTLGYNRSKQAQAAASPSNDTISRTVDYELNLDSQEYMHLCYSCLNQNRLYTLSQDTDVGGEHAYKAVVAMDTAVLSIYGKTTDPEFDGLWTGLNFQSINTVKIGGYHRVVVHAKGAAGENKMYLMNEEKTAYLDGPSSSPVCRVYTGAIDVSGAEDTRDRRGIAKFEFAELWASDIIGKASFTVYWRPYGQTLWQTTPTGTVNFSPAGRPGSVHGMRFSAGTDVTGDNFQINYNMVKFFEFAIEWTGRANIDCIVVDLSTQKAGINAACENDGTAEITITDGEDGTDLDDLAYEIE